MVTAAAGTPPMVSPELDAWAADVKEIGAQVSTHSSAERVKEAKDNISPPRASVFDGRQGGKA
jgi:hypothetical protein